MNPLPVWFVVTLAVFGVLSFFMSVIAFLALVWKVSAAVTSFTLQQERQSETNAARADTEKGIMELIREFMAAEKSANQEQRETTEKIWTAITVHAMRLNSLEGKPPTELTGLPSRGGD